MPAAQARGMKPAKFVETAAISDMFEIQSSQAALEKSTRDDVKEFAQHMIDDHTKVSGEMKALLQSANIDAQIPMDLDKKHAQQVTKMQGMSGAKFDAAYIAAQVKGHQEAVRLYQSYAQSGDNAELKQFAQTTLPSLQEHLKHAQSLKSGKSGKSGAKTSMR
jgi:putative membrane protein